MKHEAWAIGLAVLFFSAGCAATRQVGTSPFDRRSSSWSARTDDLVIVVRNDHWLPVRVWVDWPGCHEFLGDVAAGDVGTF
jgi:hypothetical protein